MKNIALKRILNVKPYIPGKPIDEVKRELKLKSVIKLASNENPYGPSPKAAKAIVQAAKDLNRYPAGDCYYLRQALAKRLKVNPKQLIFGNGSDEVLVMAIRSFVSEGDQVIVAKPSFLIYEIASTLVGAEIKTIPLVNFRYDLEAMKAAITNRTKVIFIGNPDNPAGSYFTENEIVGFLKSISSDILVVLDEAYFEYVTPKDYVDSIKLLGSFKNLLVTRTFSKMYGLAGLRIGYGVANEETIEILDRVREPFNVNSLAQVAALACLDDQKYYRLLSRKITEQRKFLYKQLQDLKLEYVPSFTNFILIKIGPNASEVAKALLKKGVIIRDMRAWGLNDCIRVTIGTENENKRFINALEEVL